MTVEWSKHGGSEVLGHVVRNLPSMYVA